MKLQFKLDYKDPNTMGRLGTITYNGKTYETPMFMPVGTNATVKTLSPEELVDIGYVTLASASTLDKEVSKGTKTEQAVVVGKLVAERAVAKGISEVVFDRGGYLYHGRVKALADSARENGLKF